ncbi:hypothetical protein KIH26_10960 [Variovorax sp. PCZ-1]|nr:hypothetical protein [Variovorax sp. PCZ-1]
MADDHQVVGELKLDGTQTSLDLNSDKWLPHIDQGSVVRGRAFSGEHLTLLNCLSAGNGTISFSDTDRRYRTSVFPHFTAIGRCHIEPIGNSVKAIHFSTTDLHTLFYDFDAFGTLIDAEPVIDTILQERRKLRPVSSGDWPIIGYFTGKNLIASADTEVGRILVKHYPQYSSGGTSGVHIQNQIRVSIEPKVSTTIDAAIDSVYVVACFLSFFAGRRQSIDEIVVTTTEVLDDIETSLEIVPSYRWGNGIEDKLLAPHPGDIPLDPIRCSQEFNTVLIAWIARSGGWRRARGQMLNCLTKSNTYDSDRLVAAANAFDILPPEAVPTANSLTEDIVQAHDACRDIFRRLPKSAERDSVLSTLGRLGKPSLPKKVAHRAAIVELQIGEKFPELQYVGSLAVKCRNFYVHGTSATFDFSKFEAHTPFLTDALEFIFTASDFIEAGWNAPRWLKNPYGWGHSFTRFRDGYTAHLAELKRADQM